MMKTRTGMVIAVVLVGGVFVGRQMLKRPAISRAAATSRPAHAEYVPQASKYPLTYPVTDQARSLMRTAREQIGLTTQDMQALGLSTAETIAVLDVIHKWVEPQQAELDRARQELKAVRAACLSTEGRIFSLEQRLKLMQDQPEPDAELRERLTGDLERQRVALPDRRKAYEEILSVDEARFAPLIEQVEDVLSLPQRKLWAASRRNKALGLPVTLQFLPDVTTEQVKRLPGADSLESVFTPEQIAVNAQAMADYKSHKQPVYLAEMKFFYGRDLQADPNTGAPAHAQLVSQQNPAHGDGSGDASKCPFSRLFGGGRKQPEESH